MVCEITQLTAIFATNDGRLAQQKINDNYLSLTRHETTVSDIHVHTTSCFWYADSTYSFHDLHH